MKRQSSPLPAFLRAQQVAEILSVSVGTLSAWRKRKYGPKFFRLSGFKRSAWRYRVSDVEKWLERRAVDPSDNTYGESSTAE